MVAKLIECIIFLSAATPADSYAYDMVLPHHTPKDCSCGLWSDNGSSAVLWRNASALALVQPLAVTRLPISKLKNRPTEYINAGMLVLSPELHVYNMLIAMWRNGNFKLQHSDDELGDQDVFIDLCIDQQACGPVHELAPNEPNA